MEVQRQAKLNLGIIIAAATLLEQKIAYLRLYNLIGKWLEPTGYNVDGSAQYRQISRQTNIAGSGMGERHVIPIDGELPP
ncbi:hypothetical protein IAI19_11765, partial [Streptococcus pseudopneumoniae]|uniref:hypothetical protein n=1 Tax=Streptococcus pseudopneumoniae TaxID=257758 RepID=UPI0018B02891